MYGLQVRLDLVAFVLIFAQLIAADTYALPPMTSLVNQCFDGPLGAQVCVQVNKTGCLAMSVGLSLNDVQLLNEERSIAQLVQDIKLNNSATLPLSYCKNVDITLTTCNACIEVKNYRMTTQSRTIELSGSVSVTCPGDINQSFKIDGLRLDDCFWVCPNDCTNGVCSVDGKCQCNAGYYGPDCSIHEQNNCYNGTIFPNNNLCIQYSDEECRLLIAHAVSSGSTVYNHYYNIMNITHPANRNKHYPIFHSNNAAISPGCRATIYAYRYVIDAYIERVNPPLKHCRAVDYECQGHKDLLIMGTYPIGQCSDTVIVVNQTRCNPPTPKPPMVREPISHGHFPPIPPTPPVAPPRSGPPPRPAVPSNQEPLDEVEGESNIGKNVVIALAVLVGAGILAAGAYILYKRWKQRQQIEMIGEYVTEDIFDSDDDEELVTLEPQPGLRV